MRENNDGSTGVLSFPDFSRRFASFTALSFVDIKELTTDDIVEINGEKWILSNRHKTKVNFQVKLLDIPLQMVANEMKKFKQR